MADEYRLNCAPLIVFLLLLTDPLDPISPSPISSCGDEDSVVAIRVGCSFSMLLRPVVAAVVVAVADDDDDDELSSAFIEEEDEAAVLVIEAVTPP